MEDIKYHTKRKIKRRCRVTNGIKRIHDWNKWDKKKKTQDIIRYGIKEDKTEINGIKYAIKEDKTIINGIKEVKTL